jgi:hypothetical protein
MKNWLIVWFKLIVWSKKYDITPSSVTTALTSPNGTKVHSGISPQTFSARWALPNKLTPFLSINLQMNFCCEAPRCVPVSRRPIVGWRSSSSVSSFTDYYSCFENRSLQWSRFKAEQFTAEHQRRTCNNYVRTSIGLTPLSSNFMPVSATNSRNRSSNCSRPKQYKYRMSLRRYNTSKFLRCFNNTLSESNRRRRKGPSSKEIEIAWFVEVRLLSQCSEVPLNSSRSLTRCFKCRNRGWTRVRWPKWRKSKRCWMMWLRCSSAWVQWLKCRRRWSIGRVFSRDR